MAFLKPDRLRKGDSVAIVSPSWGGPSIFTPVYENGLLALKELGLNIVEYPTARAKADYLHAHPELRAKDINDAFTNKNIKAIFASIGGDDSVRILPFLDKEIIKQNPKILIGFSDTTTLLTYCNQLGLVTFQGPAIMAGFSQMHSLPKDHQSHVYEMLFQPKENYTYKLCDRFSDGYPEWALPENLGMVKEPKPTDGWHFLQGQTTVQGELFGGCIEVLEFMKATDFWPERNFWNNKILFLETSEEKPSPKNIRRWLRNYAAQGVFDKISALLLGRPRSYSDDEKEQLDIMLLDVVANEFGRVDLPIISNMDFGHTEPNSILPLGIKAEVNCNQRTFRLVESWLL